MTFVMLEGDLDEIERCAYDAEIYNVGASNHIIDIKVDHPGVCGFCEMMGESTKLYFVSINKLKESMSKIVNQPIYVDGKEI